VPWPFAAAVPSLLWLLLLLLLLLQFKAMTNPDNLFAKYSVTS